MVTRCGRLLALLALAAASAFPASVLISGNSMDSSNATFTGNLAQLGGNTYTFVPPSGFASTSLAGYDLVWLDGFSLYVNLTNLVPYLAAGGRVLVQNPGFGSEPLSQYPDGAGLSAVFVDENTVQILIPNDPINAGLSSAGLTGWNPSAYGFFSLVPGAYRALSNDGNTGEDVTIELASGPGLLVYTEQGISEFLRTRSFGPGEAPLRFLSNLTSVPEPGTPATLTVSLLLLCAAASARRSSAGQGRSAPR